MEILQLRAFRFYLHSLPSRTHLSTDNCVTRRLAAISHRPSSLLFTG
jgi:hypothetical protein